MNQIRERQVIRLVEACVALPPGERREYLDTECAGDSDLRRRVEAIVRQAAGGGSTAVFHSDHEKALPAHYRLIEMIGRGGMAEVFLAEDVRLGRSVAIKFLNSEFRKDPDRMLRFNQEAKAASALNHPNILTIHDIGENEGVQYIVSEYVEGETLSARISRGSLPLPEAIGIAVQIASALAASHKAGIVHRDIKPDNVMIRHDGTVKVLDFGLAKETGNNFSLAVDSYANTLARGLTSPGLILGTPQYMSPEQARGQELDTRTDIFSLGIIIFEMVTGRPPFGGSTMADIMSAILNKEPPRIEEFVENPPVALIGIVRKALRKDKEERYATAEQLLSDLVDLRNESDTGPHGARVTGRTMATTTFQNTMQTVLSGRLVNWKVLLLLVVLPAAAAGAWWLWSSGRAGAPSQQGSMRTVPITSWINAPGELVTAASFSPDTRFVAFSSTRSGATEIYVKPVGGGDPIQVTRGGFYNLYPVWSPNNQDIAFYSNRGKDSGIWRVAFTGGEPVQVTGGLRQSARPIRWSPDGKIYLQESGEIFAIDERTGERTQVTDMAGVGVKARTIELSPDRSAVAFSQKDEDLWKVKTMRLDSQTANEIAVTRDQIDNLKWNPNGTTVFYSSSVDGAFQIFEAGPGLSGPVRLSNGTLDFFVQDVSSDGSKILYGSETEASDLWRVEVDTGKQSVVANDIAAEYWPDVSPGGGDVAYQSVSQVGRPYRGTVNIKPLGSAAAAPTVVSAEGFAPAWSHNGQWVAFFRRMGKGISIWRVRTTGEQALKVAEGEIQTVDYVAVPYLKIGIGQFAWSPDDKYIAYSAADDGVSNIRLASASADRDVRLTDNKDTTERYYLPSWTPDGKFVIFCSDFPTRPGSQERQYRLWLYDTERSEKSLLFDADRRFRFLGLSDDGNSAVVAHRSETMDTSQTPDATDVYLVSLKTGAKRTASSLGNAFFHNIHLSRDGKTVAFVSRKDNTTALWTVPVAGGTPKRVFVEDDPKVLISSLAWSPDGRTLVFGKQTRTNLISMLTK